MLYQSLPLDIRFQIMKEWIMNEDLFNYDLSLKNSIELNPNKEIFLMEFFMISGDSDNIGWLLKNKIKLYKFEINRWTDEIEKYLFNFSKYLTHVTLHDYPENAKFIFDIKNCPNLIYLNLSIHGHKILSSSSKQLPLLTHIIRSNYPSLQSPSILMFTQNCPNIIHLDLGEYRGLTDMYLRSFVGCCQKLTFLNLSQCYKITDISLESITSNCKFLNMLNISNCYQLTDLSVIFEKLLFLTHFCSGGSCDVNMRCLDLIIENKLKIQYFEFDAYEFENCEEKIVTISEIVGKMRINGLSIRKETSYTLKNIEFNDPFFL